MEKLNMQIFNELAKKTLAGDGKSFSWLKGWKLSDE